MTSGMPTRFPADKSTADGRLAKLRRGLSGDPDAQILLDWIDPPPTLKGFAGAIRALHDVLEHLRQVAEIDRSLEVSPEIVDALQRGRASVQSVVAQGTGLVRRDTPYGTIGQNPLHALLYSAAQPPGSARAQLAVAVTWAAARTLPTLRPDPRYASTAKSAFDGLRGALANPQMHLALPENFTSVANYHRSLRSAIENTGSEGGVHLGPVEILLRYVCQQSRISPSREDRHAPHIETEGTARIGLRCDSGRRGEDVQNGRNSGLSDGEVLGDSDIEFVEIASIPPELDLPENERAVVPMPRELSLGAQVLARKRAIGQLERAAQILPCSWQRLSIAEIAALDAYVRSRALETICSQRGRFHAGGAQSDEREEGAIAVAMRLLVRLGLSPTAIAHLGLYPSIEDVPASGPATLAVALVDGALVLPALRPKARPAFRGSDFTLAQETQQWFTLPLRRDELALLRRLPAARSLAAAQPENVARMHPAFGKPAAFLESLEEVWKRDVLAQFPRITLTRACNAFYDYALARLGDPVTAGMLCLREHRLADTQLHYSSLNVVALTHTYLKVRASFISALAQNLNLDRLYVTPVMDVEPAHHVGSSITPTRETISRLTHDLSRAWSDARRSGADPLYVIHLHNALAAFAHTLLAFTSGLRAVIDRMPSAEMVDLDMGIMLLSDKDDPAGFSTRTVPLADVTARQLGHWFAHCRRLPALLAPMLTERGWTAPSQLIFYLAPDRERGVVHTTRNSSLVEQGIKDAIGWFKLPENCNRHALRSELVRRGCPSEFIDAFMGHWVRGSQPFGRYATLLPQHYLDTLRTQLNAIADDYGFRAIRGAV